SKDVRGGGRGHADPCIRPPAAAPPALLASTDPPLPRGLPLPDISRRSCQVCHNRKSPFRVNSVRGGAIAREKRQSAGYKKRMGTAIMTSRDPGRVNKPLLTEAVMFFSDQGIAREMLFTEFEALLDGLVAAPDFADETVEAVFLQINSRLYVRAAVFFTVDFDLDGYVNRVWNLPLRTLAEKAARGADMGGGPIRLSCLGFCHHKAYQHTMWKPGQRGGKADAAWIKQAVTRHGVGITAEDEEEAADSVDPLLEMTAEMERLRKSHAGEVDEYLRQIGELQARLRQQEQEHRDELDRLRGEHADHLTIVRGELQDIKRQLEEQ